MIMCLMQVGILKRQIALEFTIHNDNGAAAFMLRLINSANMSLQDEVSLTSL